MTNLITGSGDRPGLRLVTTTPYLPLGGGGGGSGDAGQLCPLPIDTGARLVTSGGVVMVK